MVDEVVEVEVDEVVAVEVEVCEVVAVLPVVPALVVVSPKPPPNRPPPFWRGARTLAFCGSSRRS